MYKKRWNIDFAGVLASDNEVVKNNVFVNKQGLLQFYIKIISILPEDFPSEVKIVTCFAEDIGYPDTSFDDEERELKLAEFLEKYILFFNIEVQPGIGNDYYIARNISYVKKNDEFKREEGLNQIPVFSGDAEQITQQIFESKLLNNRFVGDNKNISNDDYDTPNVICWKDPVSDNLSLYGPFDSHDYAHGGFRFKFNSSNLFTLDLSEDNFFNYYENNNVLYLPLNVFYQLEQKMEINGTKLVNEETLQDHVSSSSLTKSVTKTIPALTPNPEKIPATEKEEQFMEAFNERCITNELYYDPKDLYNFHTAMKTGSLVILAGMSGTGKSKLVQCYADALDLKKEQQLFIPVRPYWQDDADVIGYLDILNNVYRPGDSGLVNILIHAYNNPDQMHIVCFDEMNIARVEHYFSQFLSVLEMDDNKRVLRLYNDESQYRIYNSNQYEPSIKIGNNVLFVGTVNLDESTYQFSDKVLDRANVINLNVISYEKISELVENSRGSESKITKLDISATAYNSFRNKESKIGLLELESKCLWDIHKELQKTNRNLGVGWRIVKQIGNYLNNIPQNSELKREEAFDLQLVQRVLTKILGTEEQFKELLGTYDADKKAVIDSKLIKILDNVQGYDMKKTRELILEKSRELKLYGCTI
ncbi:AAA family ATPase [Lysinibacillus sp. FJAT-14222]|uniref:McrB family protein n=1 Tax=Lysinibacillus sp. FJAT-14222 TaxID=1932366 RepID=UPI0006B02D39|nr:AAA family ATPase [Lysinibacillus sp. FJAT-14222]KOS63814.1 AAA family ATPase [Lysinibacillus sp. FJAT-14222]